MTQENVASPDALYSHARFVRGLAAHLLGEDDGADDVVQQTWLRASKHEAPAGPGRRSWLGRIARNLVHDQRREASRRRRREEVAARPEAVAGPDELVAREQVLQEVVAAVLALPTPLRQVVFLRYYEERSYAEIAQQLDLPENTVGSRLRRARTTLKETLDARLGDSLPWTAVLAGMLQKAPGSAAGAGAGSGSSLLVGACAALLLGGVVTLFAVLLWENDDDTGTRADLIGVALDEEAVDKDGAAEEDRRRRSGSRPRRPIEVSPFKGESRHEKTEDAPSAESTAASVNPDAAAEAGGDLTKDEATTAAPIGGAGSRRGISRETGWPQSRGDIGRTGYSSAHPPHYERIAWRTKLDFRCDVAPVASRTALFVTGTRRHVAAVARDDGRILWQVDLKKTSARGTLRGIPPLLIGKLLLVTTLKSGIVALSVADGSEVWRTEGVGKTAWGPVGDADGVFAPSKKSAFVGISPKDGTTIYTGRIHTRRWLPPALSKKHLFVVRRRQTELTVLLRADGSKVASAALPHEADMPPLVFDQVVVVPFNHHGAIAYRLEGSKLVKLWHHPGLSESGWLKSAALTESRACLLHKEGLITLDLMTGREDLRILTGFRSAASPLTLARDHLVWVDGGESLAAFHGQTGGSAGRVDLRYTEPRPKGRFATEPLLLDHEAFLLSTAGELIAIR